MTSRAVGLATLLVALLALILFAREMARITPSSSPSPATATAAGVVASATPTRTPTASASTTPPASPTPTPAVFAGICTSIGGLPDRDCTPGVVDPAVTQDNLKATICHAGYTATVRPPVDYTNALKKQGMADYGEPGTAADYEEDHLIPLELGGSPTDPNNLWPEPYAEPNGARDKDRVENFLHDEVCSGRMALAEAQNLIATNWEAVNIGGTTEQAMPPSQPAAGDTPATGCCRVCTTGKACGDGCISKSYTCHQPPGCACNAN